MKRFGSTFAVALALVCLLATARSSAAGEQVPFKGSLDSDVSHSPQPPLDFVLVEGEGEATHFGAFEFEFPHVVAGWGRCLWWLRRSRADITEPVPALAYTTPELFIRGGRDVRALIRLIAVFVSQYQYAEVEVFLNGRLVAEDDAPRKLGHHSRRVNSGARRLLHLRNKRREQPSFVPGW